MAFRSSFPRLILILLLFTVSLTLFQNIRLDMNQDTQNTRTNSVQNETFELVAFHPPPQHKFVPHTTTDSRVPLDQLIASNNTIVGDVQFLLDFSIIGFGKCGTSTMMHWLAGHDEIQSFRTEIWDLMGHRPDNLVRRLYQELPMGDYKRGYKSPMEITQLHILNDYRTLFPKTKLFVGVRHPIRWFESLYNFRVQNLRPGQAKMMEPNKLIGKCSRGMRQCCTDKGNFAYNLLMLGKHLEGSTAYRMTSLENEIVGRSKRDWFNTSDIVGVPNPVFFFDVQQLADDNEERQSVFRKDVQNYLGLATDLPPLSRHIPGRVWNAKLQKEKDREKIDICDPKHIPVRRELMRMSKKNSEWIRTVFLNSPNVIVSSRYFLEEVLSEWMNDPCSNETEIVHYSGPNLKFPTVN